MNNLKTKNKLFFFFFIFILIPISSFSINVNAYTPTVKANWLYVQKADFQDINPYSWKNKIKFTTGGYDLISFENLGIASYNDTEVLYKAEATFGFEMTAHTSVGFGDVFPYIDLDTEHSEMFFRIQRKYWDKVVSNRFYVTWQGIDYGAVERFHEYTGELPITVGIKEITPPSGTISLNGITFSIPRYTTRMIQVDVGEVRDGEVGKYEDIFTNAAGIDEGNVEFDILTDDFTDDEAEIIKYFQNADLGWDEGAIERGRNLQQQWIDTDQKGTVHDNMDIKWDTGFTFNQYVDLRPQVYEMIQYNDIRGAEIKFWEWGLYAGDIEVITSPHTWTAPKRVVAIHTNNYFIHVDFIVYVEFYATIPSTAKLTESILADPYLKRGDMVWDTSFTGDYDVDIALDKRDIWELLGLDDLFGSFEDIITLIIIIAIIGIGGFIAFKVYIAKQARKRMEMRIGSGRRN